jgi:hypothetical protein
LIDHYYFGIYGGPNSVQGLITGLDPQLTYSVTFFAGSSWSGTSDNGFTVYEIGSKIDSIYVQNNTKTTLTFTGIRPVSNGTISFTMSKGSTAAVGYLNALIIKTEAAIAPVAPKIISVTNDTAKNGNQVSIKWQPGSDNTQRFLVYRSTDKDSTYTLLNPDDSNGTMSEFKDSSVSANSLYYYYVVANNTFGNSSSTDTLSIRTLPIPPVISRISDLYAETGQDTSFQVRSLGDDDEQLSFSLENAPAFVTINNNANNTATISVDLSDVEPIRYDSIRVIGTSSTGASTFEFFNLIVTDGGILSELYLNFTDANHLYRIIFIVLHGII